MKRILSLTLLYLAIATTCFAQECELCGTWYGNYSVPNPDGGEIELKISLKIRKAGDNYRIRMKYDNLTLGMEHKYGVCRVTYADNHTISWQIDEQKEYDNKEKEYYSKHNSFTARYSVQDGVLYLTQTGDWVNCYDSRQIFIRRIDFPEIGPRRINNIPLFNEEDNF